MNRSKSIVFCLLATLSALFFSGCNTAEGFGKDVEKAGDKIQDNAR
jgi:predicted small secreted protein